MEYSARLGTAAAVHDTGGLGVVLTLGGALLITLVVGLVVARANSRPNSRTRTILGAGLKAIPGVGIIVGGTVVFFVGLAYFVFLFFYWLVDFVVQSIFDSFTGGKWHAGPIYGDIGGHGLLYAGGGMALMLVGMLWLMIVGAFAAGRVASQVPGTGLPPGP